MALQEAELEIDHSALEISRSAILVGIKQIVVGVLQTPVIAGGLLFMRSENRAREHARCHEETMATLKEQCDAQQTQHAEAMTALNALIERMSLT